MESEDINLDGPKEQRALDALMCLAILENGQPIDESEPTEEDINIFMSGPPPDLTPEEADVLDKIQASLPENMRKWRAASDGCLVAEDEKSE